METLEQTMTVRPLEVAEIPICVPLAQRFHEEMHLRGRLIPEVFVRNWTIFLTTQTAVIFGLWKGEAVAGGLGAMIVPDLLDDRLTANEFFWFVDQPYRKGLGGMRLLRAFEAWAADHHAEELRMIHMVGKNGVQLEHIYGKLGYEDFEHCYIKPVTRKEGGSWPSLPQP